MRKPRSAFRRDAASYNSLRKQAYHTAHCARISTMSLSLPWCVPKPLLRTFHLAVSIAKTRWLKPVGALRSKQDTCYKSLFSQWPVAGVVSDGIVARLPWLHGQVLGPSFSLIFNKSFWEGSLTDGMKSRRNRPILSMWMTAVNPRATG